jgi:hypothetical protein
MGPHRRNETDLSSLSRLSFITDVRVNDDGTIVDQTRQASRLMRVLGLDDREYTEFRQMRMEIVDLAAREDPELHRKLMGFPGDLPNVARLRPSGGNSRPEGIEPRRSREPASDRVTSRRYNRCNRGKIFGSRADSRKKIRGLVDRTR